MNRFQKGLLAGTSLLLLTFGQQAEAKVQPATIFASDMVLQQQQASLPLWGTATPNKQVSISTSWNKQIYTTRADQQGRWKTTITTPKAGGGPCTITLNDGEPTVLKNILIGEVWICSGQSNMEMPMKGFYGQPLEERTNMDIMCSTNPALRLFNVERCSVVEPQTDVKGQWMLATPASVRDFSAVAYYFGSQLQQTLGIPVGLVSTYWGGSSVEAWMSREMLAQYPEIQLPKVPKDIKVQNRTPSTLYNGMMHPIKELGMRGMIWYQGESNVERANQYTALFEHFILSLRKEWKVGEFPFFFCQIAPYYHYKDNNSAFLREAQQEAELRIPNTGMAVLLDAGDRDCIHPQKKKVVGQRLALQALVRTYGMAGAAAQSPVYKELTTRNDTAILSFDRAPVGITSYNKPLKLFTVAGEDQVFHPAKAWMVGNTKVYVVSEQVKKPVAVRYAFDNYVEGELFGVEGLPVSSFRTDRF